MSWILSAVSLPILLLLCVPATIGEQARTEVVDDWDKGFKGEINLNITDDVTDGWTMTLSFPVPTPNLQIWRAEIVQNKDDKVYTMGNKTWNSQLEKVIYTLAFIADKSVEGLPPNGIVMFERGAPPTMQPPTAGRSSPRSTTQRPSSSPSPSYTPSTNRFSSTRRPKPTKRPRSTRRPKPTKRPRSTRRPKPTKRPSSTRRPKPTKRPSSTRRPKPTKRPSSTRRPKPTKRPKSTPPPKPTTAGKYNYNEVLKLSILFYEAQRSGKLPRNNRVKWRKDSALKDKGVDGEDLTGGWYDAGDYVKFGFPMASSVTVLAWGLVEYKQAYVAAGQYNQVLKSIKWATDYFIKAHVKKDEFYGQVGDGDLDHDYWGRPEDMTMNRPAFKICPKKPGSDLAAETAAALAAASIAFKGRKGYAKNLLLHAKQLYEFADNHRGVYSDSIPNAAKFYKSWSGYKDELVWGAAWLYRATKEPSYLAKAERYYKDFGMNGEAWAFSWDDKRAGVQLLLAQLTKKESYEADIKKSLDAWLPGGTVKYTPKGLAWRIKWGSNRYAANTAFLALVAADHGITPAAYRDFATKQIHYMLGDTGRSFVVGFGKTPPQRPHHRSSSCPSAPERCDKSNIDDPEPNAHVLKGALVGGPDE